MCIFKKKVPPPASSQTIEEIIKEKSAGMSEEQLGQYYYELNALIFNLVGKVDIDIFEISGADWTSLAQAQYPTLTEIELPDNFLFTTTLDGLKKILQRDWTNRIKYLAEKFDCDDFAHMLSERLNYYYGLTAIIEVWGDTSAGPHAFCLAVVQEGDKLIARLIEPQSDDVFITDGPNGVYAPKETK